MLRKSCNSLAELCPNKNESVLDVIAFFVEGRGTEIVGWGSEEELKFLGVV